MQNHLEVPRAVFKTCVGWVGGRGKSKQRKEKYKSNWNKEDLVLEKGESCRQSLQTKVRRDSTPQCLWKTRLIHRPTSRNHFPCSWTLFSNNYISLDLFSFLSPGNPSSTITTFWSIQIMNLLRNFFDLSRFHLCCVKYTDLKPVL